MTVFNYEFVTVPLGGWMFTTQDGRPCLRAPLSLVTALTIDGGVTAQQLLEAIDACPLWAPLVPPNPGVSVRVKLPQFSAVIFFQRDAGAVSPETSRQRLKEFLLGPMEARDTSAWRQGASRRVTKPPQDRRFDQLTAQHLCDNASTYARSVPRRDFLAYGVNASFARRLSKSADAGFNLETLNTRVLRAGNAVIQDSVVRMLEGGAVSESTYPALKMLLKQQLDSEQSVASLGSEMESLRQGLSMLADRVHGYLPSDARVQGQAGQTVTEQELKNHIDQREPNTLLRLASKDPVLAEELGLLIRGWVCLELDAPTEQLCEAGLDLDPSMNPDVAFSTQPTVFRFDGPVIFPAPMNPALKRTGAMAWLNDRDGGQDYRALQVDADGELIKSWVLQRSNTLNTRETARATEAGVPVDPPLDTLQSSGVTVTNADVPLKDPAVQDQLRRDPADQLGAEMAGINQPETKGVTFSASPLDLLTNSDPMYGADAREQTNKYWLEDLWIGYRIDVARRRERPHFISLNLEQVKYAPPGMSWSIGLKQNETFFEREQFCGDRPTGAEITTWTGAIEGRRNPLAGERSHCVPESGPLDPIVDLTGKQVESRLGEHPALHYAMRGCWRTRNVLCGGISLSPKEADDYLGPIESRNQNWRDFVQELNFLRAEAYSPGELMNPDVEDSNGEQTLFLLEAGARKSVILAPRPLGLSEMWFGEYIGVSADEPKLYRDVAMTRNLRRLLIDKGRLRDQAYFADRAVHEVVVRSQRVNRNSIAAAEDHVSEAVECEMVLPQPLKALTLRYGERDQWLRYRPLRLEFRAGRDESPRVTGGGREGHFEIPPGDIVELSILPNVSKNQLQDSFFFQNVMSGAKTESGGVAFQALQGFDPLPMFPIIAERRLRVIHATRQPRQAPVLMLDMRTIKRETQGAEFGPMLYTLPRHEKDHKAYLTGLVRVDAATTGQLYFEVRWSEINDLGEQPSYVQVEGRFVTAARNVLLRPAPELLPDKALKIAVSSESAEVNANSLAAQLDHMSVENIVHLSEPSDADEGRAQMHCNGFDFKSAARRIARVIPHARTRYREQYGEGKDEQFERVGAPVTIEAASQLVAPQVRVAHVLPTFPSEPGGSVGLRVYLERPWFLTGVGERCAIGCLFRAQDTTDEYATAKKYSTLWGEDVFELPRLKETFRVPRATDFAAPAADDGGDIDRALYPAFSAAEAAAVSYYDNVPLAVVADETSKTTPMVQEQRGLALASFALRFDGSQRRHFFDVQVKGAFIGWLKLALYRHQPGSMPGFEISPMPTFVYAAVLNEVPCLQYAEHDWWVVRIGPCFDRTVTYRAGWSRGVGPGVIEKPTTPSRELSSQEINGQRFFVLRVTAREREDLTIYQLRTGAVQSAFRA